MTNINYNYVHSNLILLDVYLESNEENCGGYLFWPHRVDEGNALMRTRRYCFRWDGNRSSHSPAAIKKLNSGKLIPAKKLRVPFVSLRRLRIR